MFKAPLSPQVAFFYDRTYTLAQQAARGVLRYVRAFGPWFITPKAPRANLSLPKGCCGILACAPEFDLIRALARTNIPTVLIGFTQFSDETLRPGDPLPQIPLPQVTTDSRAFGEQAANFFLAKTPRTFVYVPDLDGTILWSVERGEAFADRIRQAGHDVHFFPTAKTPLHPNREIARLAKWLLKLPKPLSIFAANDERARQVLDACLRANISVPHEAMILGIDNDEWICESATPSLSSIPFRSEEIGFEAAQMLDDLMRRRASHPNLPLPTAQKFLPPQTVVERESTVDRFVSDALVGKALSFIHFNKGLNIRAVDVAAAVGLSNNWLETRFRQTLGTSITDEIAKARLPTVLQLIQETAIPFQDIARRCGFTNASTLCRLVKEQTGQTMTALRAGS